MQIPERPHTWKRRGGREPHAGGGARWKSKRIKATQFFFNRPSNNGGEKGPGKGGKKAAISRGNKKDVIETLTPATRGQRKKKTGNTKGS